MRTQIKQWLEPPIFPGDPEKTAQARLMNTIGLYFFIALVVSALVFVPFFAKHQAESWAVLALLFVLYIIARYFLFRGQLEFASTFMVTAGWGICTGLAVLGGGIASPVVIVVVAITTVIGLLFRTRVGNAFLIANLVGGLGLAVFQQSGAALPSFFSYSPISTWFFVALALVFMNRTMDLVVGRLENALALARQQNSAREQAEMTGQESEAKYRKLYETMRDGFVYVDMTGRLKEFNETYRHMLGYDSGQLENLTYVDLTPAQWHAFEQTIIQEQVLAQGYSSVYEKEYRRKDGKIFPVELRTILVRDKDGKDQGMWAIVRNITERKRGEQALRKSEAKFRAVVENSNDGILFGDANAVISYRSPSYSRINGYADQERVGHSGFETVHPDDMDGMRQYWAQVVQRPGVPLHAEYRIRHKDGAWRWVETTAQNLLENPDIREIVVTTRDITERKQAEHALRESDILLKSAVEAAPIILFTLDANGIFQLSTGAGLKSIGLRPGQVVGLSHYDVYRDLESANENVRRALKGEPVNFSMEALGVSWDVRYAPLSGPDNEIKGMVGTAVDITERKQRERELQAIAALSAALRTAATRTDMLPIIVQQIVSLLDCDSVTIEIIDPQTGDSVVEAAHGAWAPLVGSRQKSGTGINAIISKTRAPYHTPDLENDPNLTYPEWARAGVRGCAGAPLIAQEKLIGYIWGGRKTDLVAAEVRLLAATADIAANAIHRATLHEQTQKNAADLELAYDTTLEGWAHALDLRDHETEGHTRRVVDTTLKLAQLMGVSQTELEDIRRGALLHDIGKMGIPDSVLHKPGALNEDEWVIMKRHPEYAYMLLTPIDYLRKALDIPYCHHEKWDGTGYPRGLQGENIPLAARIFAVVDVWDALRHPRPYRQAWPDDQVHEYIRAQTGTHFDPRAVQLFFQLLSNSARFN
ncbi:MAG: PAS domain S-box protein [Anaerolineae bacterium]